MRNSREQSQSLVFFPSTPLAGFAGSAALPPLMDDTWIQSSRNVLDFSHRGLGVIWQQRGKSLPQFGIRMGGSGDSGTQRDDAVRGGNPRGEILGGICGVLSQLSLPIPGHSLRKGGGALTLHMKSSSVAVMAGWGFMEWCMTRMAGSGGGTGLRPPKNPKP